MTVTGLDALFSSEVTDASVMVTMKKKKILPFHIVLAAKTKFTLSVSSSRSPSPLDDGTPSFTSACKKKGVIISQPSETSTVSSKLPLWNISCSVIVDTLGCDEGEVNRQTFPHPSFFILFYHFLLPPSSTNFSHRLSHILYRLRS